jgi:Ring hydroxylating alpha subunit (catalytic domain)
VDPDSCIFEVYTLERFPPGDEPRPENVHCQEISEEKWRKVLCQDFSNMEAIQQGLKSRGFTGMKPSPVEEAPIVNFHRVLASYMGSGGPEELK